MGNIQPKQRIPLKEVQHSKYLIKILVEPLREYRDKITIVCMCYLLHSVCKAASLKKKKLRRSDKEVVINLTLSSNLKNDTN